MKRGLMTMLVGFASGSSALDTIANSVLRSRVEERTDEGSAHNYSFLAVLFL